MNSNVTILDELLVKQLAKQAKNNGHDLTYTQLLNEFAASHFSVRNYHELRKQLKQSLARYQKDEGGATRCTYCQLLFVPGVPEDDVEHIKLHAAYEKAERHFGFLPANYKERERVKRLGYGWMYDVSGAHARDGALTVLFAQFERSLDSAIRNGGWRNHPYFDEYIRHALPSADNLLPKIRQSLEAEYGVASSPRVHDTYWQSEADMSEGGDAVIGNELRQHVLQLAAQPKEH